MAELDLTEAIEKLALLMTGRLGMPGEARTWEDLGPHARAAYLESATEVIDLVAPLIERAVRERAAQELLDWAHSLDRNNPAMWTRRRHIGMCAQRIAPEPTEEEIRAALVNLLSGMAGRVCHLDEAGRSIPPPSRGDGETGRSGDQSDVLLETAGEEENETNG